VRRVARRPRNTIAILDIFLRRSEVIHPDGSSYRIRNRETLFQA